MQIEKITTMVTSFPVYFSIVFPCKFKCFFLSLKFKLQRKKFHPSFRLSLQVHDFKPQWQKYHFKARESHYKMKKQREEKENFFLYFRKEKVKTKKMLIFAVGRCKPFSSLLPYTGLKCLYLGLPKFCWGQVTSCQNEIWWMQCYIRVKSGVNFIWHKTFCQWT